MAAEDDGHEELVIPLSSDVFSKVMDFCERHRGLDFDAGFNEYGISTPLLVITELCAAACYLEVEKLLCFTCAAIGLTGYDIDSLRKIIHKFFPKDADMQFEGS